MPEQTPEQKDSQLEGQRTDPDRSVQRASLTGYVVMGLVVVVVFLLIYMLAPRG
ncbi:hypothetical protein [Allomeiothermus silvanus]|uniref:hypothetical protein n=1 Tax=Allomeiothermus silvanus TaxID=52022 RepID=UPI0023F36FA5|nr:hypothetical protein [Allomeiothermus silvanus]